MSKSNIVNGSNSKNTKKRRFALRKIRYQETSIINICDLNLVGKEIEQNDFSINLSKEYFYQEEITAEDAKIILKSSTIMNLVGKDIVEIALKLNLAKENSVKILGNVPFLMIFSFMGKY
jgi:hypothetical protein